MMVLKWCSLPANTSQLQYFTEAQVAAVALGVAAGVVAPMILYIHAYLEEHVFLLVQADMHINI